MYYLFFFFKTVYPGLYFKINIENSRVLFVNTLESFEAKDNEYDSR